MALDQNTYNERIQKSNTEQDLERTRTELLGRNGILTNELKVIGMLPADQRKAEGLRLNALKETFETAIRVQSNRLQSKQDDLMVGDPIDITAPGILNQFGHRHPVSLVLDSLTDVFWQMGYSVADGPEIETQWHNFEALNIPEDHPARDMQDTFYLKGGLVPRTHTSGIQIRHMIENKDNLPIRIIAPGKVYRNEDEDMTHSWSFNQLEGLVVDKNISLADLKGTLDVMLKGILGPKTQLRLRPNYFPYTEPSVEMDAMMESGEWLELGGAGMVHPQVLRNVGIDPSIYSGFAFGFGPERIAAIRYGVNDVREFWRPSLKFLKQF